MNRIITNTRHFICYENMANLRNYTCKDWIKHINFDALNYKRNLIMQTDFYEMYLLCWLPGQRTKMHDHPGNGCMFKILHGELNERIYDHNFDMVRSYTHELGSTVGMLDRIHCMENKSTEYAASLHIYSNPNNLEKKVNK